MVIKLEEGNGKREQEKLAEREMCDKRARMKS